MVKDLENATAFQQKDAIPELAKDHGFQQAGVGMPAMASQCSFEREQ